MEVVSKKTVRFALLVAKAGKPEAVTLWTAPEENREFMKAVRENRVATLIQANVGSKKDYALVGFFKEPRASYLVFPRTLPSADETKIVGIKYDELAESRPNGPLHKTNARRLPGIPMRKTRDSKKEERTPEAIMREAKPAKPTAKPPEKPRLIRFRSKVEIRTRQAMTIEVEAASETMARQTDQEQGSRTASESRRGENHSHDRKTETSESVSPV